MTSSHQCSLRLLRLRLGQLLFLISPTWKGFWSSIGSVYAYLFFIFFDVWQVGFGGRNAELISSSSDLKAIPARGSGISSRFEVLRLFWSPQMERFGGVSNRLSAALPTVISFTIKESIERGLRHVGLYVLAVFVLLAPRLSTTPGKTNTCRWADGDTHPLHYPALGKKRSVSQEVIVSHVTAAAQDHMRARGGGA